MLKIIKAFIRARKISHYSREKVLSMRKELLRKELTRAYDHSPFYRELWNKSGIKRENLSTTPLHKFPIVNKKQLMESFENVVTQADITKQDVEQFIKNDPLGRSLYKDKYTAINTSGSSGYVGIFLFSQEFWARVIGVVMARLLTFPLYYFLTGKIRIAFIGEASGHHAGFSLVSAAPPILKTLSVDVSWSPDQLAKYLNDFKPNVLVGYASGLVAIAELQSGGTINLKPRIILASGEPLTPAREEGITSAFSLRPIDFYGATECLAMGASLYESGVLDIFDDILFIESVDDAGNPVPPGELGRVVITLFHNDIQPLIRYGLDDEIVLAPESQSHSFTRATQVSGRKLERITLTLENGKIVEVHPMDLVGLFFPGLKHYQVVQTGPRSITLKMVVEGDKDAIRKEIKNMVGLLLDEKGLQEKDVDLHIEFVDHILPDSKTGKTPIIVPLR